MWSVFLKDRREVIDRTKKIAVQFGLYWVINTIDADVDVVRRIFFLKI